MQKAPQKGANNTIKSLPQSMSQNLSLAHSIAISRAYEVSHLVKILVSSGTSRFEFFCGRLHDYNGNQSIHPCEQHQSVSHAQSRHPRMSPK